MKKIIVLLAIMVIALSFNTYATHNIKRGLNNQCRAFGFDFGIATWIWRHRWIHQHEFPLGEDWETSVTGTRTVATWDVGPIHDFGDTGIVVKQGRDHYSINGTNGTITEDRPINYIIFCFSPVSCEPPPPPP